MIQLQNVIPSPLEEAGLNPQSQVFATDCNFEIGKKYLVTAPSGKGKSTLIHLLYGLRNDYTGDIAIDDQETRGISPDAWADLRQKTMSIVFQNLRLFPQLTTYENIVLKSNITETFTKESILEMADLLGIEELMTNPIEILSYGQRQRVAIIRALCQPFDFLLLDEPFSHLDEDNIAAAVKLILKEVNKNDAGLIMVSLQEDYGITYDKHYEL